jgi:aspartyl-tRNA(Asn)/glutamyl-tRNA(Gln) amidotransferase subunit A
MSDPCELSLVEAAAALRRRKISSLELTRACIARIERWQPALNAFVGLEAEEALAQARAADDALSAGSSVGPLHGLPLAHKDMYYRPGKVSTCGSRIRRDWVADTESTALSRLSRAGALQLGTLNMAEFAYGITGHNEFLGHCRNPWNTDYITGGSSSGSGAAVASRLVFGALGSDTGGSIRAPSGLCGVTGIKPTWGRVSRYGAMPLSPTLDVVGPIARSAADCALLLQTMAGHDPLDPQSSREPVPDYVGALSKSLQGLCVGVPEKRLADEVDPGVAKAVREAAAALRDLGVRVIEVEGPDVDSLSAHSLLVMQVESSSLHGPWMRERKADYSSQVRARLEAGYAIPATAYLDSLRFRGLALEHFCVDTLAGVDALLMPVMSTPTPTIAETDVGGGPGMARTIGEVSRYLRWVNYLGVPALVLNGGFDARGLPIGIQIIGRPFAESTLFRLGHAYQGATDWHRRVPVSG